jgi:cytochrome c
VRLAGRTAAKGLGCRRGPSGHHHLRIVMVTLRVALSLVVLVVFWTPAKAQLRGHGGAVRALAVAADGASMLSGSFDTSVILWSLRSGLAQRVLRFHEGAVNCVAFLGDGRIVTGSEDGAIAIWWPGSDWPSLVLRGHTAPVVGLAVSPDGSWIGSASRDQTARLWPLTGGPARVLVGHRQSVNAVAFTPDGRAMVSAGYDGTVRLWPLANAQLPTILTLPTPLNSALVAADGEIIVGGGDGKVYVLSPLGERKSEIAATSGPIVALALSKDGKRVAAAGVRGSIAIIDRHRRLVDRVLVDAGGPVWSVAFEPDNQTLLTGGADNLIHRWDVRTGQPVGPVALVGNVDPLAAYANVPGAMVFRACIACHTLRVDEGNRAGPSLAGLFGRRIASLPGYNFSAALKKLDIVWTPQTLSRLFEIGPAAYTPGTKMPEQLIGPEDRAALVGFLQQLQFGQQQQNGAASQNAGGKR